MCASPCIACSVTNKKTSREKKEMFSLFKSAVIIIRLSAFQISVLSMCKQTSEEWSGRVWKIYCRIIHLIIVTRACLFFFLYSSLTRKMFIMQISYSSIVYACCARIIFVDVGRKTTSCIHSFSPQEKIFSFLTEYHRDWPKENATINRILYTFNSYEENAQLLGIFKGIIT